MRTSRGFTLLEMLVVAAAAAVLIVPALSRARSAAKRTVCAANLKTLGEVYATPLFSGAVYPREHAYGTAVPKAWHPPPEEHARPIREGLGIFCGRGARPKGRG